MIYTEIPQRVRKNVTITLTESDTILIINALHTKIDTLNQIILNPVTSKHGSEIAERQIKRLESMIDFLNAEIN